MGRLIDDDMVISIAKGEFGEDDLSKILWLISHVPTVYKVDKVVEQLEDYLFEKYCVEGDSKIDEIVKGGGLNE